MKQLKTFFLLIGLIGFGCDLKGQECNISDRSDWKKVTVFIVDEPAQDAQHEVMGEWVVKLPKRKKNKLNTINDVPPRKLKRIKKLVASKGGCKVYIDLYNIYNLDSGLFFYWLK